MSWIGQKPEGETARPAAAGAAEGPPRPAPVSEGRRVERGEMTHTANIGKSLHVKGELTGNEDLTVEGQVDGKIALDGHRVTVAESGRVAAEIQATSVVVAGEVKGNITASERVELAATGSMQGDIRAPRVALADGAHFKGSVDMAPPASAASKPLAAAPMKSTA
jgi:cytoskeletal protein CcmA (bactofilin family)